MAIVGLAVLVVNSCRETSTPPAVTVTNVTNPPAFGTGTPIVIAPPTGANTYTAADIPTPFIMPSAGTTATPSSIDTGVVFLLDRSTSIGRQYPKDAGYCDTLPEQKGLRYQIPEFVISLMAAYHGPQATQPKISVIEFANTINTLLPLDTVSGYWQNTGWRGSLYANSNKFEDGTNYLGAIKKALTDLASVSNKIVILISDGSFIDVGNTPRQKMLDEIKSLLENDPALHFRMIRLNCPALATADPRLGDDIAQWIAMPGNVVLEDSSPAPFDSIIKTLLGDPILNDLLPKNRGWVDASFSWPTPPDIWRMTLSVVSLGASGYQLLESEPPSRNSAPQNSNSHFMTPMQGMPNAFSDQSDSEVKGGRCDSRRQWTITSFASTTTRNGYAPPLLGLYWWQTDPVPFSVKVEANRNDQGQPVSILNNAPIAVKVSLAQDRDAIIAIIKNARCYGVRLEVLDGNNQSIIFPKTVLLSDANNGGLESKWEIRDYTLYKPQALTVLATVIRDPNTAHEQPVAQGSDTPVRLEFRPTLASGARISCPSYCILTVPVQYVESNFHPGRQVEPDFYVYAHNLRNGSPGTSVTPTPPPFYCPINSLNILESNVPDQLIKFDATDKKNCDETPSQSDGITRIYTLKIDEGWLNWEYQSIHIQWDASYGWPKIECDLRPFPTQDSEAQCREK